MKHLLEDKKINTVFNILHDKIRKKAHSSQEYPKIIFICGKDIYDDKGKQKSKEILASELNKRYFLINKLEESNFKVKGSTYLKNYCIVAENLYDHNELKDLLTFEGILGEISEKIIVILESEGTCCELGAFSYSDELMKKIIVINNDDYIEKRSFIRLGPLKKIELKDESSIIYSPYKYDEFIKEYRVLDMCKEISELESSYKPNKNESQVELKSLIYEIMNIIEIFQPIQKEEILGLYKKFTGFRAFTIKNCAKHNIRNITHLLELLSKMQMIEKRADYYMCNERVTFYNSLFNIDRNEYNKLRTKINSAMYQNFSERMEINENESIAENE
ncbi:retron St85 family effector protein [Clostridium cibarium]|uniref:Uncharacterized protein n=1 Tax=Clostridium cibarium TaxID=2762247 RepID=A0ABR8PV13_9CLOT|nr:retron St85 family effector protein [Clostridium cibarium]MBD7911977.1 hypothetical protein [Clostridium cibarium]